MKKYILAFLFCLSGNTISNSVCANYTINPGLSTAVIKDLMNLKVSEFIKLSPKKYSTITGKKMNPMERISFSLMKVKMKHALKKNPNLNVGEYMVEHKKLATGWVILIIVLAVLIILAIMAAIVASATSSVVDATADAATKSGCGFGAG